MRSGTSFLLRLLSEHPQLLQLGAEMNDEWTILADLPTGARYNVFADENHANALYEQRMRQWMACYLKQARRPEALLKRMEKRWKTGSGGLFKDWKHIKLMNKNTHMLNRLRFLHRLFPNARFIFIARSIQGQSYSLKLHLKGLLEERNEFSYLPENDKDAWFIQPLAELKEVQPDYQRLFEFAQIPRAWIRLNALGLRDLNELCKDRMLILDYEYFIEHLAEELERIADFLELDHRHKAKLAKMGARERKVFNSRTNNPTQAWRTGLSPRELEIIEYEISENAADYNYIREQLSQAYR
jgi:hypothetical protein